MFQIRELKLMFFDPTDLIINSINNRDFGKIKNCYVFLSKNKRKIVAAIECHNKSIEKSLSHYLDKNIQPYMKPNFFKVYKQFPKNKNGKIDRLFLRKNY